MTIKFPKNIIAIIIFITLSLLTRQTLAAGFETNLQSASGLGNSYAGSATGIHDVSDIFFNAANLSDITRTNIMISASYININADTNSRAYFSNSSSVTGGNSNGGTDGVIPALYMATPLNDKIVFGFDITTPYGLATEYDKNWVGRYHAIDSKITSVNINPMLSYLVNDNFSIGGGLEAQYFEATLTNAVDVAALLGHTPGTEDGFGKANGNDWGYGFNLGAKYKFNNDFKIGIGYRSKVAHKLEGQAELQSQYSNTTSDFSSPITTPETLTLGISYPLNERAELSFDTSWSRWSRLKAININSINSALTQTTILNWRDSWKYALGFNFKTNNKWLIRTGLAYEKDAVTGSLRNPRLPTSNRIWTSVGAEYKINDNLKFDLAYLHQFFAKASSNLASNTKTPGLQADYDISVDVLALDFRWAF